jgi:hypothetical protein
LRRAKRRPPIDLCVHGNPAQHALVDDDRFRTEMMPWLLPIISSTIVILFQFALQGR